MLAKRTKFTAGSTEAMMPQYGLQEQVPEVKSCGHSRHAMDFEFSHVLCVDNGGHGSAAKREWEGVVEGRRDIARVGWLVRCCHHGGGPFQPSEDSALNIGNDVDQWRQFLSVDQKPPVSGRLDAEETINHFHTAAVCLCSSLVANKAKYAVCDRTSMILSRLLSSAWSVSLAPSRSCRSPESVALSPASMLPRVPRLPDRGPHGQNFWNAHGMC